MRYVIRSLSGALFSGFVTTMSAPVTVNNVLVGHDLHARPEFDAFKSRDAVKFDTASDAHAQIQNQIKNPQTGELVDNALLGGPDAFQGCTVIPTED